MNLEKGTGNAPPRLGAPDSLPVGGRVAGARGETGGPLLAPEWNPTYFILAEGAAVWGYARTVWARVTHLGRGLKLYGLGDVVTAPGLRRSGHGGRVMQEATAHIRSDREADAAVLLTEPVLEAFYGRCGWESVSGLEVRTGEHDEHHRGDSLP
jgi:GNAT superfamily N-acetyltransferase